MMEFLYFPEDKTEYIPAFIILVIFMIGATITMYLFYQKSKKDEKYFDEKFQEKDEFTYDPSKPSDDDTETK